MEPNPWKHTRNAIKCCIDCKPPKRFPGCGGTCEEYKKEKAEYLENKEKYRIERENNPPLTSFDFDKVRI